MPGPPDIYEKPLTWNIKINLIAYEGLKRQILQGTRVHTRATKCVSETFVITPGDTRQLIASVAKMSRKNLH